MGTTARTATVTIFTVVVGLATAACSVSGIFSASSTTVPVGQPRPAATDRPHRQAQDALDRWAQAVRDNGGSTGRAHPRPLSKPATQPKGSR